MNKTFLLFCFVLSFLFGLLINELNLNYIRTHNPGNIEINGKSTCFNQTIYNIDNTWYLPQIKNFIAGDGFTLDPADPHMQVRRTPLYPMFYGIHYMLFGERLSFLFIKYSQLLFYSFSVVLLCLSVFNFTKNKEWAAATALLYALSPFAIIYCSYTVTESLSPFFVVLSTYTFSVYFNKKSIASTFFLGTAIGISTLHRPILGILLVSASFLIAFEKFSLRKETILKKLKILSTVFISFMLVLTPWTIRNYFVSKGEFIPLEKFYGTSMSYGKSHYAFTNWVSCWDNPANYSLVAFSNSLISNIASKENKDSLIIEQFINGLPSPVFKGYSKSDVRYALQQLNNYYKIKTQTGSAPEISESQSAFLFNDLQKKFKAAASLTYYIFTPLNLMKSIVFQSSSYAYASLNPDDGKLTLIQKISKGIMFFFNVVLYVCLLIMLIFSSDKELKWFAGATVIINLLLFMLVYRYMEARYSIPFYPLLYISAGYVFSKIFSSRKTVPHSRS